MIFIYFLTSLLILLFFIPFSLYLTMYLFDLFSAHLLTLLSSLFSLYKINKMYLQLSASGSNTVFLSFYLSNCIHFIYIFQHHYLLFFFIFYTGETQSFSIIIIRIQHCLFFLLFIPI